jgi:RNA polymerase sigma-70 factor (ECF subfamily)
MNVMPSPARPDDPGFADPFDALPHDEAADEELPIDEAAARRAPNAAPDAAEPLILAWLERIVERDERALAALYDATLPRVYGLVLRIVRRHALADEVVEDTYFQVWRQAVRFDAARGRAMTWLLGMARSRAIDALRREARFVHDSLDIEDHPEVPDDAPPVDALLDAARGHAELQRALMLLNARPRQLVAMAFFGGLSHEEIASQTALPLGTVKSQIRRSLITLRQLLGDAGFGVPA